MASALPGGLVVRGPRPAQPLRYGLLNTVQPSTPEDGHWELSGVEWEDFLCTSVESFITHCPPASGHIKSTERDIFFCHADPFVIKGSYECAVGGRVRTISESFEIARQRLLAWEGHELERVLWTGDTANGAVNPSLQDGNDTCDIVVEDLTPVAGAVDPVAGIATLEDALTDVVPFGGVIHAPYGLAAYLGRFNQLERAGDRYFTIAGNSLILGAGYPGSGPAGVAADPGTTWIFATGPVAVWRSNVLMVPDQVSEAVDRHLNDIAVFAERSYAVGFSCAVFAINVSLTCDCTTAA